MGNKKFKLMPGGSTSVERIYELFRNHIAIIADRVRKYERCRKCFMHGFIRGKWTVKHGCDGCAEMETFISDARDEFAAEAAENGKGAKA